MEWFAFLFILGPALTCIVLTFTAAVVRRCSRRRDPCRDHVRVLLPTESGLFELCCTCDAGSVADGRWRYAPASEADHTLG